MTNEFLEYILELLEPAKNISLHKMFGGYIIRKNGLPIALISYDELYFKVNETNRSDFESIGSEPFTYEAKGKIRSLSYWKLPIEILEDSNKLMDWIEKAYQVALEARRRKKSKKISLD